MDRKTIQDWATETGKDIVSVLKQVRRRRGQASRTDILTAQEWADIYNKETKTRTIIRVQNSVANTVGSPPTRREPVAKVQPVSQPLKKAPSGTGRKWILYLLMAIPALASIQNIQGVTFDITGHLFGSALLTGLFSCAPFLFVLAGVRNAPTRVLVGFMVTYEAFCNLTRIYGGLTGFGKGGFPTRFLGLVTDIFGTGTHQTGVFLAVIMAILAASTFYAAYFELTKSGK